MEEREKKNEREGLKQENERDVDIGSKTDRKNFTSRTM